MNGCAYKAVMEGQDRAIRVRLRSPELMEALSLLFLHPLLGRIQGNTKRVV